MCSSAVSVWGHTRQTFSSPCLSTETTELPFLVHTPISGLPGESLHSVCPCGGSRLPRGRHTLTKWRETIRENGFQREPHKHKRSIRKRGGALSNILGVTNVCVLRWSGRRIRTWTVAFWFVVGKTCLIRISSVTSSTGYRWKSDWRIPSGRSLVCYGLTLMTRQTFLSTWEDTSGR